jgi:60 kDa SS-A/Ro ribonucleoprotein
MANKNLFKSLAGKLIPQTDAFNEEQAPAYAFSAKHQLAQYAATGCLNSTFYASGKDQLDQVMALCASIEPEFIAKTAIYCREKGFMKDMPALLCAFLSTKDVALLRETFDRVIDNGKMLRNFVQIIRSGAVGRKSLGSAPKRLVQSWLERQDEADLFRAIGQDPSIEDVIKMVHPKPKTAGQEALYGYLLGRPHDTACLPEIVRQYEAFKNGESEEVPDVPFMKLTALNLSKKAWVNIAGRASWQTTRMNLNTFARHGVFTRGFFTQPRVVKTIAERLRNPEAIVKARVFPYQLMAAYAMADSEIPGEIRESLQDAMEVAIQNVPAFPGKIYVCPDVSGSMSAPVTGYRKGATSAVRCIDVAALVAAAVVRKNGSAEVLPFEQDVVRVALNPRDSIMTNAAKLAAIGGGGTNCSAPLALLNSRGARGDLVVFISDNESWVDAGQGRGTATMREWQRFKSRNPEAKLVCIDIQPYGTTQAKEQSDVLNVGGFSDAVFDVLARFQAATLGEDHWIGEIEAVTLN